jgi:hypothetical protein
MQALGAWILFMTGFLIVQGLIFIRGYSVAVLSRAIWHIGNKNMPNKLIDAFVPFLANLLCWRTI